jgi:ATP-binding protein involved in chromosome partitioning
VPTNEQVLEVLATVDDPEINKPITELGMVEEVAIEGDRVGCRIKLTIPGCPLKDRITATSPPPSCSSTASTTCRSRSGR